MNRGMKYLMEQLGVLDAERFVKNLTVPADSEIILMERLRKR